MFDNYIVYHMNGYMNNKKDEDKRRRKNAKMEIMEKKLEG